MILNAHRVQAFALLFVRSKTPKHLSPELNSYTAYPPKSSQRAYNNAHNTPDHMPNVRCVYLYFDVDVFLVPSSVPDDAVSFNDLLAVRLINAMSVLFINTVYRHMAANIAIYAYIYIAIWRRDGGSSAKLLACMREFSLRLREQAPRRYDYIAKICLLYI